MSVPSVPPATAATTRRLDLWLAEHRSLSRSAARQLIDAGLVRVGGREGRPGQRVDADVSVEVLDAPAVLHEDGVGPAVALRVVLEDEWLAVIDKPAGMVVHPAPGHPHGTLADGLRQRGSTWSLTGGAERPGIVHRLDRQTSGLLIVAKTEVAHRALAAQLADRTMGRAYWALVWGGFRERTAEIDAPVGRDPRHRQRMAVVDGGRRAVTDLRVEEVHPATSLLEVTLRTGRTHQIRVHLAHIGHPIVGDAVYSLRDHAPIGRTALHAGRLRFVHPGDQRERVVVAPLPDELATLLERARRGELR